MEIKSSNGGQMGLFWGESTENLTIAIKNAAEAANKSLPGIRYSPEGSMPRTV